MQVYHLCTHIICKLVLLLLLLLLLLLWLLRAPNMDFCVTFKCVLDGFRSTRITLCGALAHTFQ